MQDAAIGIVLHPEKKDWVLWVKRRDLPIWVFPGGGIESAETPEEAVRREIYEEAGLSVRYAKKAATYLPVNRWMSTTHVFICHTEDFSTRLSEETSASCFFPISSPPEPHFPLHMEWLNETVHSNEVIERPLKEFSWKRVGCFLCKHPYILIKYLLLRLWRSH